jgi:hypothetical protein
MGPNDGGSPPRRGGRHSKVHALVASPPFVRGEAFV